MTRPRYPEVSPGVPLPAECRNMLERMLEKDPLTRIPIKHILEHPFVTQASSRMKPAPPIKQQEKSVPLYISQAIKQIHSREVVGLKVQPKKKKEI